MRSFAVGCHLQVKKIVGHAAPESFTLHVESLAVEHHAQLIVDCTRAYHFGSRFNVELEVILPAEMTVRESHDIALELQHKARTICNQCLARLSPHRYRALLPGRLAASDELRWMLCLCKGSMLCSQIEALDEVERAFVHVDYASRDMPEHKVRKAALLVAGM